MSTIKTGMTVTKRHPLGGRPDLVGTVVQLRTLRGQSPEALVRWEGTAVSSWNARELLTQNSGIIEVTEDDLCSTHVLPTSVLAAIVRGDLDMVAMAREELAARGLNESGHRTVKR